MKLLYAECCGTLVVPSRNERVPRWCECQRSCCWWDDPEAGKFAVFSNCGRDKTSIIGLHNGLLLAPFKQYDDGRGGIREYGFIQGDLIKQILEETPASYAFKTVSSLVIRCRPGFTNDTRFADYAEVRLLDTRPGARPGSYMVGSRESVTVHEDGTMSVVLLAKGDCDGGRGDSAGPAGAGPNDDSGGSVCADP